MSLLVMDFNHHIVENSNSSINKIERTNIAFVLEIHNSSNQSNSFRILGHNDSQIQHYGDSKNE